MSRETAQITIEEWIYSAREDPKKRDIRRAMSLILEAVASSQTLQSRLVIKGGVLLALEYGSGRHTRDIDFSVKEKHDEQSEDAITEELDKNLKIISAKHDNEILCAVQSTRRKPSTPDATFPTIRIKVGYAIQGTRQYKRMIQKGQSSDTVTVDISFNEDSTEGAVVQIDGGCVKAYSIYDQIAEKYRAIVQQKGSLRNRARRQDCYDIYRVLQNIDLDSEDDKKRALEAIQRKFGSHDVPCGQDSLDDQEIRERSERNYESLRDDLEVDLPPFNTVFNAIRAYYRSLPW